MNTFVRRIVLSVFFALLFGACYAVSSVFMPVIQGQVGVHQLDNDPISAGFSLWFAQNNVAAWLLFGLFIAVLTIIWMPWAFKVRNNGDIRPPMMSAAIVLILMSILLSACGPYTGKTTPVQIGSNQTAFMLPARGDTTDQTKMGSIDLLAEKKVAAKIVYITYAKHQLGRAWYDYDLVPNEMLFLVDRSPVNRRWTYNTENGTASSNQAVPLESLESIGFYHGVTISAVIEEEDAATFLYYYGGSGTINAPENPNDSIQDGVRLVVGLDNVMDDFVYTWVAGELYAKFKALPLEEDQRQAGDIFAQVEADAIANFKPYGITILSLGGIEGLIYDDDNVQAAINEKFNAASKATAQAITNGNNVDQANTRATMTVAEAKAQAEAIQMTGEELSRYPSIINKILAEKSTGQVPSVLVTNSDNGTQTMPFPFWFYQPTPTAPTSPTSTSQPVTVP